MKLPIEELYRIEGEAGPLLDRAKAALDWLLSPQAEGIGESLLRDAYELHGQPVSIRATTLNPQGCQYVHQEHRVDINPDFLQHVVFKAKDGTHFSPSVESVLGHELTHATQRGWAEAEKMWENAFAAYTEKLFSIFDRREDVLTHIHAGLNTPYQLTAREQIRKATDSMLTFTREELPTYIEHPDYQRYLKEYEAPAVAMESRISALQNMPSRADYLSSGLSNEGVEKQIEGMRQMVDHQVGIDEKAGIAPFSHEHAQKLWQQYVKDSSEFKLTKPDHPLLAVYKDGGRS